MRLSLASGGRVSALLAGVWVLAAVLLLLPGRFAINGIEGDTLHALDGAMRMLAGARPHLDFATPLGMLAFGTLAVPLGLGFGPGTSMLLANLGVALLCLPGLAWFARTRGPGWTALLLGLLVLVEAVALVYDAPQAATSFALHYNRWGWAVWTLAMALMLFPPARGRSETGDGLVLGLALAVLALTKMTYFVSLLLPAAAFLAGGRRWRALAVTAATGLAVAALVTVWAGGPSFWRAYLGDLLLVATSESRARPGMSLADVVASPGTFLGTGAILAAIVLLRIGGRRAEGVVLLAALPGVMLVTYQNWGNAPVWLALVALVAVGHAGQLAPGRTLLGRPLGTALAATGVVAATAVAPYLANAALSPVRHLALRAADYAPAIPLPGWDDLHFLSARSARVRGEVPVGPPVATPTEARARFEDLETVFRGRTFPACAVKSGLILHMTRRAEALRAVPELAAAPRLDADLLNVSWMFSGGVPMLAGSPWYYGGAGGLAGAQFVVVPLCPLSPLARGLMLAALDATGAEFVERHADATVVVYERITASRVASAR